MGVLQPHPLGLTPPRTFVICPRTLNLRELCSLKQTPLPIDQIEDPRNIKMNSDFFYIILKLAYKRDTPTKNLTM